MTSIPTSTHSLAGLRQRSLVRRAVKGDEAAFALIFERYHQELYRYCLAILRDTHDAEDALQATMAAALRGLPGEGRRIELKPWLYRVAHNESVSLLRGRRETSELSDDPALASDGADVTFERTERLRLLVADLRALPDRHRGALVMRELNGLDYEEIGEALQSSEQGARQTVYEARTSLKEFEDGRSMDCAPVRQAISDGDGRRLRSRRLRAHLRGCTGCREFQSSIGARTADFQGLCPPLPAVAAAGILGGALGSGGGTGGVSGATAGAAAASGTAATILGGAIGVGALKGAGALVAAIAAFGAADLAGVVSLPGGGGSTAVKSAGPEVPSTPAATPTSFGGGPGTGEPSSAGAGASGGGKGSEGGPGPGSSDRDRSPGSGRDARGDGAGGTQGQGHGNGGGGGRGDGPAGPGPGGGSSAAGGNPQPPEQAQSNPPGSSASNGSAGGAGGLGGSSSSGAGSAASAGGGASERGAASSAGSSGNGVAGAPGQSK